MKRPVVHIGYPKTGSTWLQNHVWNNPRLGLCAAMTRLEVYRMFRQPHPLDFQARTAQCELQRRVAERVSRECVPTISDEALSGSLFAAGYDSAEIASRLHQVLPDARIVMVIREQKGIILSSYRQYVRDGGQCSLRRFLCPPGLAAMYYPLFSVDHYRYEPLVSTYRRLFGEDNVHVAIFEQLQRDPAAFARKIVQFAHGNSEFVDGLDELPMQQRANTMLSSLGLAVKRKLNVITAGRHSLSSWSLVTSDYLGHRLTTSLFNPVTRIVSLLTPRQVDELLDRRDRRLLASLLGDRFQQPNRQLSTLLGTNLTDFGYDVAESELNPRSSSKE